MPRLALLPLLLLPLLLLPGRAMAQDGIPVQQLQPLPGGDENPVQTGGSRPLVHLHQAYDLVLNYAWKPLALTDERTDVAVSLVEHMLAADILAAVGLGDDWEVGLAVPATLYQAPLRPRPSSRRTQHYAGFAQRVTGRHAVCAERRPCRPVRSTSPRTTQESDLVAILK